ncbi:MAG: hypothetical protein WC438_06175 [Candidatus Pacearchaeota archaeon]
MIEIICPKCGAMSYLEKDTQSPTGWKCSKCQMSCVRKNLTEEERIQRLKKDDLLYPISISEEIVHKETEALQENTKQIKILKNKIKKRGKQLSLFD